MNEQELIIQGNQASVLMPKLKRYIDEQIAALSGGVASKAYVDEQIKALSEKDKNTLFVNFSEVTPAEPQILLYLAPNHNWLDVYLHATPSDIEGGEPAGIKGSIMQGIWDRYHDDYPWVDSDSSRQVVDGYITLATIGSEGRGFFPMDTPWLRLGHTYYGEGLTDVIEQHFGHLKGVLGGDDKEERLVIADFLTGGGYINLYHNSIRPVKGITFSLGGWMLLKNS